MKHWVQLRIAPLSANNDANEISHASAKSFSPKPRTLKNMHQTTLIALAYIQCEHWTAGKVLLTHTNTITWHTTHSVGNRLTHIHVGRWQTHRVQNIQMETCGAHAYDVHSSGCCGNFYFPIEWISHRWDNKTGGIKNAHKRIIRCCNNKDLILRCIILLHRFVGLEFLLRTDHKMKTNKKKIVLIIIGEVS